MFWGGGGREWERCGEMGTLELSSLLSSFCNFLKKQDMVEDGVILSRLN